MKGKRKSVAKILLLILSILLWITLEILRDTLGPTITDSLQILEIVVLAFSGGIQAIQMLQPLPTPVGVKEFKVLFPDTSDDEPEFLRDSLPKLVDFKAGYIVRPPETIGKIMGVLHIPEGETAKRKVRKNQSTSRFHAGITAGPPGCGKTTTSFRLAFDLQHRGWTTYFSDASHLFVNSTIEKVTEWFISLRGSVLLVIDNAHLNGDQVFALLEELNERLGQQRRYLPSTFRVLCLETYAYLKSTQQKESSTTYIAGTRVNRIPLEVDDAIGLAGLHIERRWPSTQLAGKTSTLYIEEGREIAQTVFKVFVDLETYSPAFGFEKVFSETGTVVELCETLKRILQTEREDDSLSLETPWVGIPEYAVTRRTRSLQNPQQGVRLLGLVSTFSQAGSIVAREFIEKVVGEDISQTLSELENARYIIRSHIGPAMREFLMLTHQVVASLIRRGCSEVLMDLYRIDDDHEVSVRIFTDYVDYVRDLPPRTSKRIGSSFLLSVSSYSSFSDIDRLVDFVSEQCRVYSNKDNNIEYCMYNTGVYYMTKGRFEQSKVMFKEVLRLNPDFHQAQLNLGVALLFNNELEAARDELEQVLQKTPENTVTLTNLARVNHLLGDLEEALELLESAREQSPTDDRIIHHQAKIEFELGRVDRALKLIRGIIEKDGKDPEVYATLGQILLMKNELGRAEQVLSDALKRGLESPALLNNLGAAIKKQGRLPEAKTHFSRCLELDSTYAVALVNMGDVLLKEGDLTGAQDLASRALESDPKQPIAHALQGLIFMNVRQFTKAKESFEKAISLGFQEPDILRSLAYSHYELQEYTRFKSRIEQSIKASVNPALPMIEVWRFCLSKKDERRSKIYGSRIVKTINELLSSRQFELVEPALEKLSEIQPSSFELWANLGTARAMLGKPAKAIASFERAIAVNPNDAGIWLNFGNALKELGQHARAEEAYAKARSLRGETEFDPDKGWNLTS